MIDLLDPLVLIAGLHQNLTSKPIVPKGAMAVYPDKPCAHEIVYGDPSKLEIIPHSPVEPLSSSESEESILLAERTMPSSDLCSPISPSENFDDILFESSSEGEM